MLHLFFSLTNIVLILIVIYNDNIIIIDNNEIFL